MSIYGLIIGIAIVIGIEFLRKKTKLFTYLDYLLLSLSALIGARAIFLIHNIEEVKKGLISILNISDGGLAFFGALIGILLALVLFSVKKKIPFLTLSDTLLPFLPLIQAIGRIGNYFNNELYGKPSQLPWAIEIPLENRLKGYEQFETFHPAFLYESLLSLLLFFILFKISAKKTSKGLLTGIYFIGYSLIRLLMNRIRIDREYIMGIETSDFFSSLLLVLGTIIILNIINVKVRILIANFFSKIVIISLVLFSAIIIAIKIDISYIHLAILFLFTFLLPISTIILFNILGIISNINVTKREERKKLFSVLFILILISLLTSIYIGSEQLIVIFSVIITTFAFGLLITFFWKISFHMILSCISIFSVIYLFNTQSSYFLILVLPFIAWSRVTLERHTYPQVLVGTLLPLISIFLVLTFLKF